MLPDLNGRLRSVSLPNVHALDHTRLYAKSRSLRRKFHHLDDALAVVLGEVKGLAVGACAEAGLQAGRALVENVQGYSIARKRIDSCAALRSSSVLKSVGVVTRLFHFFGRSIS